jgi:hypothetical protein
MIVEQEREIDAALADEILGKVGDSDSVWLVFDMDGTLANLKNKDTDILRPSLGGFFSKFVEKGMTVYFGIYSNNHSHANLDLVAGKIQELVDSPVKTNSQSKTKSKFHVCFKVHNFHEFRDGIDGVKKANIQLSSWDRDKTYETIDYAYKKCGHPIDKPKHVFFFDDRHHYSVKEVLDANYIHVSEYKKPKSATTKKRGRNQITRRSRKYRKTQRKYRR